MIDLLKELQDKYQLRDHQFAENIGITRSYWSYIRSGKRNLNVNVLLAAARCYPEVKKPIAEFLGLGID